MMLARPTRFRRHALAALALLAAPAAACAAPGGAAAGDDPPQGQAAVTAFVDVTVIPMDRERVLEHQTVVVRDGRITQIGPAAQLRAPAGAQVVDGRGKFLMPGLAEMHAHIPGPQAGDAVIERTLFLYLAGGVTTIRGMLGDPKHLELRERAARGALLSPRIYTSGPSFNGNTAPTPELARRMVEEQKAAGYDLLKIHPGVPRAAYDAMAETAHRLRIPFAGHVPAEVGVRRALEARQATIDHLDGYAEALVRDGYTFSPQQAGTFGSGLGSQLDPAKIPALVQATRAAGTWNVPTQTLMEHLVSAEDPEAMARRPEMRYMPAATVEQWVRQKRAFQQQSGYSPEAARRYIEARRRLIKELHDSGAGLLLGSDAPQWWNVPGFSAQRELAFLVQAGLTPYQALATGTRAPAVHLGAEEQFGTVAVGRSADLLLLDASPLADIANLERLSGVMVRGRWLPASEIRRRLDEVAAAVRG